MRVWIAALIMMVSTTGWSQSSGSSNSKKTEKVNFEDLLVQGKYHFSDEAVVTVEDDKILDALLGVRKDFRDKIEQSASRN